jgi:hypothetical protein
MGCVCRHGIQAEARKWLDPLIKLLPSFDEMVFGKIGAA